MKNFLSGHYKFLCFCFGGIYSSYVLIEIEFMAWHVLKLGLPLNGFSQLCKSRVLHICMPMWLQPKTRQILRDRVMLALDWILSYHRFLHLSDKCITKIMRCLKTFLTRFTFSLKAMFDVCLCGLSNIFLYFIVFTGLCPYVFIYWTFLFVL